MQKAQIGRSGAQEHLPLEDPTVSSLTDELQELVLRDLLTAPLELFVDGSLLLLGDLDGLGLLLGLSGVFHGGGRV